MKTGRSGRGGFSLVEVTIALGIAAFALLALVGTLPVGLGTHQSARSETAGVNLVTSLGAAIRMASEEEAVEAPYGMFELHPASSAGSPPVIPFGDAGSFADTFYISANGVFGVPVEEASYRLTVRLAAAGADSRRNMHLLLSWPAASDPFAQGAASAGSVETVLNIPFR